MANNRLTNTSAKKVKEWALKCLYSLGYTLTSEKPELVKHTPWSYLIRFESSEGYLYLKQTPELFALEPTIIQILHDDFHASVPTVIACNTRLNCFLMKDAGHTLRDVLKQQFDEVLLCRAIDQFTSLQIAASNRLEVFLDSGVPDYRLDKLPGLYNELLLQKELLISENFSALEIKQLRVLLPKIDDLCIQLSNYGIPQTIVQPDFNDNNTLIDESLQTITLIDVGEIVISHPFFSLLNCLEQIKKHHGLTEYEDRYLEIKEACFKNYLCFFQTKEQLSDAFAIAQLVKRIYAIAYEYRFMIACGKERLIAFQHWKLGKLLKELMCII